MNSELDQTANEALRALIDNAASAKEFILAELPEVVQQLLMWKTAESIAYCILSLCMAVSVSVAIRWQWKNREAHFKSTVVTASDGAVYMVNLFLAAPIIAAVVHWNLTWLQIWIAPKVYLLEYAADLVK